MIGLVGSHLLVRLARNLKASNIMQLQSIDCNVGDADLFWHRDTFSVDESENLVVVHDGVHAFDPDGVHGTIKHYPLLIHFLI